MATIDLLGIADPGQMLFTSVQHPMVLDFSIVYRVFIKMEMLPWNYCIITRFPTQLID